MRIVRSDQDDEKNAPLPLSPDRPSPASAPPHPPFGATTRARALSRRALLIAVGLMTLNIALVFYAEPVRASQISNSGMFAPVIFFLFLLTAANALAARLAPRCALSPAELLTVYVMLAIQTSISSGRFIFWLLSAITYGFHYASPANQWITLYGDRIPTWLTVRDPETLRAYFLGNSTLFTAHHLQVWLVPVLAWALFLCVLGVVLLAVAALFSPSWIHQERLTYPVVELPFQMVSERSHFWREHTMWLGFALAAGMELLNGLHTWFPSVPLIPLRRTNIGALFTDKPWSVISGLNISFYPFIIGLSFLMPLDLSFSVLFFFFAGLGQSVLGSVWGLDQHPRYPYSSEQQLGAVLAILGMTVVGLVRRRLTTDHRRPTNEREGRSSFIGQWLVVGGRWSVVAVLGSLFLIGFLTVAGMAWWVAAFVVLSYLGLGIVVARIRAQLGFPNHDLTGLNAASVLTRMAGSELLGMRNIAMLGMVGGFTYYNSHHLLPQQVEGLKLADRQGLTPGSMTRAIVLAILISVPATFLINLAAIYHLGAGTAKMHWSLDMAQYIWERSLPRWTNELRYPDPQSLAVVAGGTGVALLLNELRQRFLGFPLHPVGMALTGPIGDVWGAVAIGAVFKGVLLRYSGLRGYRQALPFFLGLILGDLVMGMTWITLGVLLDVPTYVFFL